MLRGAACVIFLVDMARSKQLTRLEPWHHDLIDWMLQNPGATGLGAAAHFGVSPVWISIVKNSGVFRAELERRREKISQAVATDIVGRAGALAELSLDVLNERIQKDGGTMSTDELCDTAAMALKALGFGARQAPRSGASSVNVQVNVVDRELLERAREKMRRFGQVRDEGGDIARLAPPER